MNSDNPLEELRNLSRTVAKKQREQKKREQYSQWVEATDLTATVSEKRQRLQEEIEEAERLNKPILVNRTLLILMLGLVILTGLYYYAEAKKDKTDFLKNLPVKEIVPQNTDEYKTVKIFAEKIVKFMAYKGEDSLNTMWAPFVSEEYKYYSLARLKKLENFENFKITEIFRYKNSDKDIYYVKYSPLTGTDNTIILSVLQDENDEFRLISVE